jgi:hypothetical protein
MSGDVPDPLWLGKRFVAILETGLRTAPGIYRVQPAGVPTWSGYKQTERLDISFPVPWDSS